MTSKLKTHFPLIRERKEILTAIQSNLNLANIYNSWTTARQNEFMNFCTGVKGIKVLYDSFFKEVMNPEYAPERLEAFLCTVLKRKVKIVRILPNDSTRIADEASLLITDIIVELEDGSLANVEIQKIGYSFPGERCACYSSDMLLRQYKRVRSAQGDNFSYNNIQTVYLIVIYENSPKEFKRFPTLYYHHGKQIFDTGLQLNMLQEYIMIPLDIFHENMDNKIIETPLEAWLTFLSSDSPDRIIELITHFPEFKPMYENLYQMCLNIERVMNMFSEELRILDRNTVKYMIEEQQQEIDRQKEALAEKELQIHNLLETRINTIKNMLQDNMSIEKIATLLSCNISDVEDVKKTMNL
ncbi:MAG: PD-(D/E)XK nuclease family transposase [Roseburia sp.]|nr:PD-(D/E)XK nuclease family transposase [Roseburia sp.]